MDDRAGQNAEGDRRGTIASFLRFVACGGSTGVASGAAISAVGGHMPVAIANAVITVVSTVVATELHSRITFRDGRSGWRVHAQSGFTALVCYLFTTAAMLALQAVRPDAGVMLTQAVYLSASGLAGIGRFVALKVVVFARPRRAEPPADGAVTGDGMSLTRGSMTTAA